MRDKLVDLEVASVTATRSNMNITNSEEMVACTRESIEEMLSQHLMPEDQENG